MVLYHIHLCERANQERQREAWHSWFQSEGVIFILAVYFTSPLFTDPVGGWACCLGSESWSETSSLSPPILCLAAAMRAQPQPQPLSCLQLSSALHHGTLWEAQGHALVITAMWVHAGGPAWATRTGHAHPRLPLAVYLPLTTRSCQLETFVKLWRPFSSILSAAHCLCFTDWKPSRIQHHLKFIWVGVGEVGAIVSRKVLIKNGFWLLFQKKKDVTFKM